MRVSHKDFFTVANLYIAFFHDRKLDLINVIVSLFLFFIAFFVTLKVRHFFTIRLFYKSVIVFLHDLLDNKLYDFVKFNMRIDLA